jgi:Ca2+-transporting ATPase
MAAVLSLRSDDESFFRFGIRRNPALIGAVALTLVLQLAVTYVPFLQELFETTALTATDLLICVGAGVLMLVGIEIEKALFRRSEMAERANHRARRRTANHA